MKNLYLLLLLITVNSFAQQETYEPITYKYFEKQTDENAIKSVLHSEKFSRFRLKKLGASFQLNKPMEWNEKTDFVLYGIVGKDLKDEPLKSILIVNVKSGSYDGYEFYQDFSDSLLMNADELRNLINQYISLRAYYDFVEPKELKTYTSSKKNIDLNKSMLTKNGVLTKSPEKAKYFETEGRVDLLNCQFNSSNKLKTADGTNRIVYVFPESDPYSPASSKEEYHQRKIDDNLSVISAEKGMFLYFKESDVFISLKNDQINRLMSWFK